jgi:hypothetical protein
MFTPGLMRVQGDLFMQGLGQTGKYMTGGVIDAGSNILTLQSSTSMLNSCVYSSNITGKTLNLVYAFTTATLSGTFVISNNVNTGGNLLTSSGDLSVTQNVYTANLIGNIIAFSNVIRVAGNLVADTITANVVAYQNNIRTFQISGRDLTGDGLLGSNNVTSSARTEFGSAYGTFTLGSAVTHGFSNVYARDTSAQTLSTYSNNATLVTLIGTLQSNLNTGTNAIVGTGQLISPLMTATNFYLGANTVTAQGTVISGVLNGGVIGANTIYSWGGVTAGDAFGNLNAGANNIVAGDRMTSSIFTGQFRAGNNTISVSNVFGSTISATSLQAGSNDLTMATLSGTMLGTMNCGSNNVTTSTGNITSSVFYGSVTAINMSVSNVTSSNIVGRVIGSNVITANLFRAGELIGGIQSTSNLQTTGVIVAQLLQGSLSLFANTMSASDGNIFVGTRLYTAGVQGWANNFSVRAAAANQFEGTLLVYTNLVSSTGLYIGGDLSGPINAYTNTMTSSNLIAPVYSGTVTASNITSAAVTAGLAIGPINNSTGVLSTERSVIAADIYGGITALNNVIFTQNTISYTFDQTDMGIFMLPDSSNAAAIGRSLSHYISNVNSSGGFWSQPPAHKVGFFSWRAPPVTGQTSFVIGKAPSGYNAVYFPGAVDSWINLGSLPNVNQNLLLADTLVETWIYVNSYTSNNYIISSAQEGGFENWTLYLNTSGRLTRRVRLSNGQLNTATNLSGVIPLQTWTYISVTTLTGGQFYTNVNGNWFASTGTPYSYIAGPYNFFLGYGGNSPSQTDMYIRDARIIHGGSLPTTTNYTPDTSFGYSTPTYAAGSTVAFSFSQEFLPLQTTSNGWCGVVSLPDDRVVFVPRDSDKIGCYNPKFGVYSELVPENNAVSLSQIQSLIRYEGDATDIYGLFLPGIIYGPPLQKLKFLVPYDGNSPNDTFGGIVPTVTGGITYNSVTPKFVTSASFTNTVDTSTPPSFYATYVLSPSITTLTFTGYTMACWVKILNPPGGLNNSILSTIFKFGGGSGGSASLYYTLNHSTLTTSVTGRYYVSNGGSYFDVNGTTTALTIGTWYHAAFVVGRATGQTGSLRVYLNGAQVGVTGSYTSLMSSFSPTLQLPGQAFSGEIDDFRILGQELSATEILNLYQTTVPYTGNTVPIYQAGKIGGALYMSAPQYSINSKISFYSPYDGSTIDVINGYTPTVTGAVSYNTSLSAKFLQSLQVINNIGVDAPANTISYGSLLGVTSSSGFTISFWGYISQLHTVNYGSLFGIRGTGATPMYFDIYEKSTELGVYGQNGASPTPSSNIITFNNATIPTVNFWYHFCLVCNTSKLMTLYINGVGQSVTLLNDFTIGEFRLGCSGGGSSRSFNGQIDDVRVYKNRVFTPSEVIQLLQLQVSGYESPYYNYTTHALSSRGLDIGPSNNASIAFWFKDADNLPPPSRQKCIFSLSNTIPAVERRLISMYYGSNAASNQYLTTSYYTPSATTNVISNVLTTFTKNTWYHLAMTFNAGTAKMFINGALQTTTTSIANDNITFRLRSGTNFLNLNYNSNNIDDGESGNQAYDEFRVYSRALSDTEVTQLYQTGSPFITGSANKWVGGVLLQNSNVLFVPSTNAYVGIYDPGRNILSLGQNTTGFNGGVLLPNGNVLCIPSSNTFLVEVDPTKPTGTATLNVPHGSGGTAPYCFSGCLLPDGNVLCAPSSGNAMIYNYRTRAVSNVLGYTAGPDKYAGCCFSPTGEVILAPGSNVVPVGRISQTGVFSSATSTFSNLITACPLGSGKILMGTTQSLGAVFDPVADTLTPVQMYGSYSGVGALQDGRAILAPNTSILGPGILNGQTPVTQVAALSPYLNKL